MGNPKLMSNVMSGIKINVPPLEKQHLVVAKLDAYEADFTMWVDCINAEITARQKQYEYYRDKLLSFEPIT